MFSMLSLKKLESENNTLKSDLSEANVKIITLEENLEQLEQYGRSTSLRFNSVPMSEADKPFTDNIILDICNNKMNLTPKITESVIDRSHIIGTIRNGKAHIIWKFKTWKANAKLYRTNKQLKHSRTDNINVYVSEDLAG